MENANKMKKFFLVTMLIICSCNILSGDNVFISNTTELLNKKYMADIKLVITYNTDSNNLIYKYATASIEIITLYADGKIINEIENEFNLSENLFFTETAENNMVIKRNKTINYFPKSKEWILFFMPRGNITYLRSYHIPWITKELRIIYRIMFPPKGYSEQKEVILKIRN